MTADIEMDGRFVLVESRYSREEYVDETRGNAELTCYVTPRVFESNREAQRLAESLGGIREGTLRNHVFHEGAELDTHVYGLLEEDRRAGDGPDDRRA